MKLVVFLILALYIIGSSTEEEKSRKGKRLDLTCLRLCTINFHPVCATNGACIYEFKNKCTMYNNNCESKKKNMPEFKLINHVLCNKPEKPCHSKDIALN